MHDQLRSKINGSLLLCGFALVAPILLFLLTVGQVSAHNTQLNGGRARQDLSLQVDMGFQATYKVNYWEPVNVSITNNGVNFTGMLTVKVFTGSPRIRNVATTSPWSFEQPVRVAGKTQQKVTVYAPFYLSNLNVLGFIATLFDKQGKAVATQTTGLGYPVTIGDLFIGVLSDNSAGFDALNSVNLPHQADSLTLSTLNASTFPDNSAVLKNFDIIILDNFNSSSLSAAQLITLQTWINQGGILFEVGGADWQRTLGSLPANLLPMQVKNIETLPAGTNVLPADSSLIATPSGTAPATGTIRTPISASVATVPAPDILESQTLLTAGKTPLIVQQQQGQGVICYIAFDLAQNSLVNWPGIGTLWTTLLLHVLGDRTLIATDTSASSSYEIDPGQLLTQGGIVRMLVPGKLLEPGLILVILLCYILMLGPIRLLIVRGLKQPKQWAWHIALITILVFSLLSLSIAAYQKHELLTDNTISLIQLTEDGSAAHILTYHGLLTPDQGTISLQLADKSLALPLSSPQLAKTPLPGPQDDPPASVTVGKSQTKLTLSGSQRWAFHPLLSERDTRLSGALTPHLTLHNNRVTGTITNTLATTLSDVYVLLPNYFIQVGHIGAGETQQINLPLHNAPLGGGKILADALARAGKLTTPYFSYNHTAQGLTDFEQHMALLAALSGAGMPVTACGGACNLNTLRDQNAIFLASAPLNDNKANTSYDPLLLSGAPATLIGWADQQIDDTDAITINGIHPGGHHENFVQMPIALTVNNLSDTPTGSIMGNAVDPQNSQAQFLLPGIYSLSSANMLFEFTLPAVEDAQGGNLSIKIPVQWEQLSGNMLNNSSVQTNLYNWHTGSWDVVPEQQGNVTIPDPGVYTGTNKQILLEITNPDNTAGPLIFGKPSLIFLHSNA